MRLLLLVLCNNRSMYRLQTATTMSVALSCFSRFLDRSGEAGEVGFLRSAAGMFR